MHKPTRVLVASSLLGVAAFASAQRAGALFEPTSQTFSQGTERGPASDPPMRVSEGPDPAVRDGPPAAEPGDAVRKDAPGPRDTTATETPDGASGKGPDDNAKPKGDISEPKSTRQDG